MALYKIVDGVKVQCTAEEEQAILAEWEANVSRPKADEFLSMLNPLLRAFIQDIAANTGRTELQVLASIKTRWQTLTGQ